MDKQSTAKKLNLNYTVEETEIVGMELFKTDDI